MYVLSMLRTPEWIDKSKWRLLNNLSLTSAISIFLILYLLNFKELVTISVSLLSYITVVSTYTDFKYRLVDRFSLYFLIFISSILALFSFSSLNEPNRVLFICLTLFSASTIFLPLFGASDGRMLLIGTLLVYPIGELKYFLVALIITSIIAILYGIVIKINSKVKKVSLPAVPMLSISFLVSLILENLDIITVVI